MLKNANIIHRPSRGRGHAHARLSRKQLAFPVISIIAKYLRDSLRRAWVAQLLCIRQSLKLDWVDLPKAYKSTPAWVRSHGNGFVDKRKSLVTERLLCFGGPCVLHHVLSSEGGSYRQGSKSNRFLYKRDLTRLRHFLLKFCSPFFCKIKSRPDCPKRSTSTPG